MVLLEPVADHLGLVVVADDQRQPPTSQTPSFFGRVELDVEDVAVLDAGAAAAEAAHDLLVGDVDQDRGGQLPAELLHLVVERLGLGTVRGKPSRMKPSAASSRCDPLGDHADDHLVGHQVAAVHVLLRLRAELGPLATAARRMSPVA